MPVGNEQLPPPTIRELAIFPLLEDSLEDLGRALSIDEQTIRAINENSSTAVKNQKEVFRAYLKTCRQPTWSDIVNALETIGKGDIAQQVIDTFELPQELLRNKSTFGCDVDPGIRKDDTRSSSVSSDQGPMNLCSDDFQSAEETPLDTVSNKTNSTIILLKADGQSSSTRMHVR